MFERTGHTYVDSMLEFLEDAIEDCPNACKWGDPNGLPDGDSYVDKINLGMAAISESISRAPRYRRMTEPDSRKLPPAYTEVNIHLSDDTVRVGHWAARAGTCVASRASW